MKRRAGGPQDARRRGPSRPPQFIDAASGRSTVARCCVTAASAGTTTYRGARSLAWDGYHVVERLGVIRPAWPIRRSSRRSRRSRRRRSSWKASARRIRTSRSASIRACSVHSRVPSARRSGSSKAANPPATHAARSMLEHALCRASTGRTPWFEARTTSSGCSRRSGRNVHTRIGHKASSGLWPGLSDRRSAGSTSRAQTPTARTRSAPRPARVRHPAPSTVPGGAAMTPRRGPGPFLAKRRRRSGVFASGVDPLALLGGADRPRALDRLDQIIEHPEAQSHEADQVRLFSTTPAASCWTP